MPNCNHCKNELGKKKKFESNKFNSKYCLETEACIGAWRNDRIAGLPKQKAVKEKSEKKEMEKKATNWNIKVATKCQKIARLIDYGLLCAARGKGGQMHGGHVYAKGGNSSMKFNLHNIHRQSAQSNHFQNDDGLLREGIANEYGSAYMVYLSELRRTPQLNYKNKDYHHFYLKASEIALKLEKEGLRIRSVKERIELRNAINLELAIYDPEYCVFDTQIYEKTG